MFKLFKFIIVGIVNTAVDITLLQLLLFFFPTQSQVHILFYNAIAYLLGACNSFFWNKLWTFKQRERVTISQIFRFFLVSCGGMLLNTGILFAVLQLYPVTGAGIQSIAVKALVAFVTMGISFGAMVFFVFTRSKRRMDMGIPGRPRTIKHGYSLSLVLPAYNEEENIEKTLSSCLWGLIRMVDDFEIIVVDDGSKDKTAELVKGVAQFEPRVKLISYPDNKGYGGALTMGFSKACKQYTMYMDSDGQFDIRDLNSMLPLLSSYDGVFGYRIKRQDKRMRLLNAWGWNMIVRFVFGLRIRDIDCAFKIFKTEYFQSVTLEARGALLSTEVVYKFIRAGYSYTEVGVKHLPRRAGQATGAKLSVILRAFKELAFYAGVWHTREQEELHAITKK